LFSDETLARWHKSVGLIPGFWGTKNPWNPKVWKPLGIFNFPSKSNKAHPNSTKKSLF
jgi:hypothetical protein